MTDQFICLPDAGMSTLLKIDPDEADKTKPESIEDAAKFALRKACCMEAAAASSQVSLYSEAGCDKKKVYDRNLLPRNPGDSKFIPTAQMPWDKRPDITQGGGTMQIQCDRSIWHHISTAMPGVTGLGMAFARVQQPRDCP